MNASPDADDKWRVRPSRFCRAHYTYVDIEYKATGANALLQWLCEYCEDILASYSIMHTISFNESLTTSPTIRKGNLELSHLACEASVLFAGVLWALAILAAWHSDPWSLGSLSELLCFSIYGNCIPAKNYGILHKFHKFLGKCLSLAAATWQAHELFVSSVCVGRWENHLLVRSAPLRV